MATLHKFKHLAIQCGAEQSPTRSPVVARLRRRKTTLGTLLRGRRRREPEIRRECLLEKTEGEDQVRRQSLKDLFQSSPPGAEDVTNNDESVANANADIFGSPKHAFTGFRYKLLLSKKAWRPILLSIAE
ncbi:hypothetical protein Fmac_001628 [Flemingia macrophylla]|uniref:Uncharacterized protein n=1 Tax=Flemingia macrophylla TaxID=520843 RepID=A0ABD1NJB8_9FABA